MIVVGATLMLGCRAPKQLQQTIVALDTGHTLVAPGATSASGISEYYFNRRMAALVESEINKLPNLKVVMTNPAGHSTDLQERCLVALHGAANLLISIHHDSFSVEEMQQSTDRAAVKDYEGPTYKYRGYSIFISRKNQHYRDSLLFARTLSNALQEQGFEPSTYHSERIPGENHPVIDLTMGLYRGDDLIVLKSADCPAVLIECGVIVSGHFIMPSSAL